MEERIIVLALCSFSRVALFSEVVISCSFSWILFLTARLGGSFKSYAHFKVSISTRKGLLSKRLRSLQGIRSLCSMKKRCVKFTYRFASRVAKMEIRNVLRLSLRYLSSETDVGADNAVHPAFSSRRKAVVSHLQSRSHFGAVSEYSICVVQHDSIFHFCLPPLPPFFCLFMIFCRKDHSARAVFVF